MLVDNDYYYEIYYQILKMLNDKNKESEEKYNSCRKGLYNLIELEEIAYQKYNMSINETIKALDSLYNSGLISYYRTNVKTLSLEYKLNILDKINSLKSISANGIYYEEDSLNEGMFEEKVSLIIMLFFRLELSRI